MKSVGQIAKEIGVSPQAIYKRIKTHPEMLDELGPHMSFERGMKFSEEGEAALKAVFAGKTVVLNQIVNQVDELTNQVEIMVDPLINQLYEENNFLREQLQGAEMRNHELALRLADLTKNNQMLIGMIENQLVEQPSQPVDPVEPAEKKGFWRQLFGKLRVGVD